jgi:dihydroorotate dehydrogenase electron transfer subunit
VLISPLELKLPDYVKESLKKNGIECAAVLGYADSNMFLKEDFEAVCDTHIAAMDGSFGTKGTVIDALNEQGVSGDVIFACGPMPMLRAIKSYSAGKGMEAYISLEERMACGVGACLGCVTKTVNADHHTHVKNSRICVEGPVFRAEDVDI